MADHLLKPQPPPVANDKPAVWDLVVQDLEQSPLETSQDKLASRPWAGPHVLALVRADAKARDAQGRERYGVQLQPDNGRDALVDAYQEALDLVVYLRQAIAERAQATAPVEEALILGHLNLLYDDALGSVRRLRWLLLARDGR